jgi:hypothetical protein
LIMTDLPPCLELAKAFAAPVAAIIASIVVATSAGVIAWRQWKTADQQAQTSLDQLRFALFKDRFAIYNNVKALLRMVINDSHKPDFDMFAVTEHYVVIDEARFFFSPELCERLQAVQADCQQFLEGRARQPTDPDYNPREDAARQTRLTEKFRGMAKTFEKELKFRQLTRSVPD